MKLSSRGGRASPLLPPASWRIPSMCQRRQNRRGNSHICPTFTATTIASPLQKHLRYIPPRQTAHSTHTEHGLRLIDVSTSHPNRRGTPCGCPRTCHAHLPTQSTAHPVGALLVGALVHTRHASAPRRAPPWLSRFTQASTLPAPGRQGPPCRWPGFVLWFRSRAEQPVCRFTPNHI